MAFDSCKVLQRNSVATSLLERVSSKYCFSSWQYIAAASTLVAEFSSQSFRHAVSGLGRTLRFVKFIIFMRPAAVLDSCLGGGGVANGDKILPETISWIAGVTVAVRTKVYCCGVRRVASSAKPFAALEYSV